MTTTIKKVGFPMIHNFDGDRRDFSPELFAFMDRYEGVEFYLEDGYGSRLGYTEQDYKDASPKVRFVSMKEAYAQDITMILKDPDLENLELLKDGSVFFTMIHYAVRPAEVELIKRKQLKAYSMDSIVDDNGLRLFVDYFGTAYCAMVEGIKVLKQTYPDFYSKDRGPIKALIMGAGGVAQNTVKSLEILSDQEFLGKEEVSGFLPIIATRTITQNKVVFEKLLKEADLLIDTTQSKDGTQVIVTNQQVGLLPEHAVILDIAAERYDFTVDPPRMRPIEGTVDGTPSHYIIYPDDPLYDELPPQIDTTNRRMEVSCDAWPGMNTERSVQHYCGLMKNYVGILLTKDYNSVTTDSDNLFERALARAKLSYFEAMNA